MRPSAAVGAVNDYLGRSVDVSIYATDDAGPAVHIYGRLERAKGAGFDLRGADDRLIALLPVQEDLIDDSSWQDRRQDSTTGADAAFIALMLKGGLTIVIGPSAQ